MNTRAKRRKRNRRSRSRSRSGILPLAEGRRGAVEIGGTQVSKCGAGGDMCAPAPRNDKKNKHRCPLQLSLRAHPLEYFTADLSVFQAHLPEHGFDGHAKPLDWKTAGPSLSGEVLVAGRGKRREWNQTIQVRWLMHPRMHGLDT
jgi:hypothetical protein